jgi:hypothetical protein
MMSEDTNEQRWQQQADLAERYRKENEALHQQARMFKELMQAMAETTGRCCIRVEYRINADKHIFVLATSAIGKEDHLARIIRKAYDNLLDASQEDEPDASGNP